jgi:predicted MFS family arabinose efflux permease
VRPFGRLLASYTVNEFGDSVGVVALALLVFARTDAVAPIAAFFIAAKFLPGALAPVLTARIDQLPLRRTLPVLYAVEAAVFVALGAIADGHFSLVLVLVLALVDGSLAITARGLTRGAVAALLQKPGLLREGNGLLNVGFAIASVGGAALAGLLVAKFGLATALYVDAVSFLVIAVLLAATARLPAVDVEREPFLPRFRDGMRYVRAHRVVRVLLAGQAVAVVLFTLIIPIEVIYAKESLHTTSAGYGILLASWGLGIVFGSLVFLRVKQRASFTLLIVSTLAIGVSYLGMAVAGTLFLACLASVIGGTGNGVQWIAVVTAVQEETDADYQARITGMLESINAAIPGVGYLLGGALVAVGSPRTAYAVAGGGLVALVCVATAFRSRFDGAQTRSERGPADVFARTPAEAARSSQH